MTTQAISTKPASPMRVLEILVDRYGAFEAVANSTIKLAKFVSEDELSMDLLMADAVLDSEMRFGARWSRSPAGWRREVKV